MVIWESTEWCFSQAVISSADIHGEMKSWNPEFPSPLPYVITTKWENGGKYTRGMPERDYNNRSWCSWVNWGDLGSWGLNPTHPKGIIRVSWYCQKKEFKDRQNTAEEQCKQEILLKWKYTRKMWEWVSSRSCAPWGLGFFCFFFLLIVVNKGVEHSLLEVKISWKQAYLLFLLYLVREVHCHCILTEKIIVWQCIMKE